MYFNNISTDRPIVSMKSQPYSLRSKHFVSGDLKTHNLISIIFKREAAYLEGPICVKFCTDIFIGACFIFRKVKESEEI